MTHTTKTYVLGLLFLCLSLTGFSANIAIIESQSFHPLQTMDDNWATVANQMGHSTLIFAQNALDDISNFDNYEIIIVSSGLISISESRQNNIIQMVEAGKHFYIQSEYEITHPGNVTFDNIVNTLEGSFSWEGQQAGGITPMNILSPIASYINEVPNITYFWYGTYGNGDMTIEPIFENSGKYWGFLFNSVNDNHGKVITIADQDWIRILHSVELMENIIGFLADAALISMQPTVTIEQTSNNICPGDMYTFEATIENTVAGLTLQWQINGTPVIQETAPTFETVNIQAGDVVECVLLFPLGNGSNYEYLSNPIKIDAILPLATPVITVEAEEDIYCEMEEVFLNATVSNTSEASNFSYQWQINGVNIPEGITSNFITNGITTTDEISCILTYDNVCTVDMIISSAVLNVNIETSVTPTLSVTNSANEICRGENVTFTATGSDWGNNPTFQWFINGELTGVNSAVFTTNTLLGGQTVSCLTTFDQTCTTLDQINIEAFPVTVTTPLDPVAIVAASTNPVCEGEEISFFVEGANWGNNPTFQWQVDGQNIANENEIIFTSNNLINGQQVTCLITFQEDCITTNELTTTPVVANITAPAVPTINIVSDYNTVCEGTMITFTAEGTLLGNAPVYQWQVDGVNMVSNASIFSSNELKDGQIVTCIVTSNSTCISQNMVTSNSIEMIMGHVSIEALEIIPESCELANGLIEVEAVGGVAPFTYNWSNGSEGSVINEIPAGIYEVEVIDAVGCSAISIFTINGVDAPQLMEIVTDHPTCEKETGTAEVIMESGTRTFNYTWVNENNFVLSKVQKVENLRPGTYTVTIEDNYGCSLVEEVIIIQQSEIEIIASKEEQLELGQDVRLHADVATNSSVTFEWFPAEGLSCADCLEPVASPVNSTIYTLTVTNAFGCTSSTEIIVKVIPKDDLYIPNAFSPNGDGVNDFFTVYGGENLAQIKSLQVLDRWGQTVYQGQNITIGQESVGWNGTHKGKVLTSGVYVYMLEVVFIDGKSKKLHGDISIIK